MSLVVYTTKEVSEMLKVDERTVRRWVAEGKINKLTNIGAIRIPKEEIEKLKEVK